MEYKKVRHTLTIRGKEVKRDYLQFRRFVGNTQQQVVYRAPDTPAGIAILDRRAV